MKKLIALVLSALMLAAVLAGCGSSGRSIDDIKKAGTLAIATSPDFPPFESLGEGNVVEGIEIDILNAICEKLAEVSGALDAVVEKAAGIAGAE